MRLVIERSELLRALGHVTSVVERRTTIPILSNVLMRASGTELQLKATDLEREVVETVPAQVSQPGAITVPAQMLHDIVRKLPEGSEVEILRDAERERLTITAGSSRFAVQTLAADDFPDLAPGEMAHTFAAGRRPQDAHREDALRHLHRGDALLPQRHLRASRPTRHGAGAARRGDGRPSPGAARSRLAEGRRGHAGRHHSAQDGARAASPARGWRRRCDHGRLGGEGALRYRPDHADLEADRRQLPGLPARHPDGQ